MSKSVTGFVVRLLFITLSLFFVHTTIALTPPNPNVIVGIQPDGLKVNLRFKGSPALNWYEDLAGFPVLFVDGRYIYQPDPDPTILPDDLRSLEVGRIDPKSTGIKRISPDQRRPFTDIPPAAQPVPPGVAPEPTPPVGTVKNLVVLLRFNDHSTRPLPSQANFDVLFNSPGGDAALAPTGSVRDLYLENSYSQLTLNSTVLDWFTVSNTEQFYSNGQSGLATTIWPAIREALDNADTLVDFADFDQDNDGLIDAITIVHSGYGAEFGGVDQYGANYTDRIWSHKWTLQPAWNSDEGVAVANYNINPGVWSTSGSAISRIGVIAHELGHFFGLPDFYDTNGGGEGLGSWGLMANSWGFTGDQLNPPHFSAYSKIELGWSTPTAIGSAGSYTLPEAESSSSVYRIDYGFPTDEYLLLENRQPTGFESTMPQGGLIVWHIDEDKASNTEEGYPGSAGWPDDHYRVAVLQADGLYDLEKGNNRGDGGDAYHPGAVDEINATTVPSTDSYQGGVLKPSNVAISVLTNGSNLDFDIGFPPPAPTFTRPTSGDIFTIATDEDVTWLQNGATAGTTYDLDKAVDCALITEFSDDMESGASNWTVYEGAGGGGQFWSLVSTNPFSGSQSWFAADVNFASEQILETSVPFTVPNADGVLSFQNNYDTEFFYDGGVVELSADGGANWIDLGSRMTTGGYNNSLSSGNPVGARPGFTGSSGGYVVTEVDLSDFSGQMVSIRFRFGTDSSVGNNGWWIDDVTVTGRDISQWDSIDTNLSGTDFSWSVTGPASANACLRLTASNAYGVSEPVVSMEFEIQAAGLPNITAPAPDSILSGASETFSWSANGAQVGEWWLYLGSVVGGSQYFDSGSLGSATSDLATGLPLDGSTVYARLWYRETVGSGSWSSVDVQYTAATGTLPEITSPLPGSTLSGASETFSWSANGAQVGEWWLYLGSVVGGSQYFSSGNLGAATSDLATGLPLDGSTVHARLWYRETVGSGSWSSVDVQYTAATGTLPEITSPLPGSTLSGASETFGWSANGAQVGEWWLYLGSVAGGSQYFSSGNLGAATSDLATGLPLDGSTVHARLWYRETVGSGSWNSVDFQYTAATGTLPEITAPVPGSVLSGASETFSWSANGAQVGEWWLYLGSVVGGSQYFDSGNLGSATSDLATGLPLDGSPVYARLWYRETVGSGSWSSVDFQYTAAN